MMLTFDGDRVVEAKECGHCARLYSLVRSFVLREGSAYAVVFAACRCHGDGNEVWIDAILGSFGGDDPSDHITFGCRAGPVQGQREPAATAVDAATPYSDQPIWGLQTDPGSSPGAPTPARVLGSGRLHLDGRSRGARARLRAGQLRPARNQR